MCLVALSMGLEVPTAGSVIASTPPGVVTPPQSIFPYFAYAPSGGSRDIRVAARLRGVPARKYMDVVCRDLAAHNFNVIWLNNVDYATLPRWLAAARRHGLRVIAQSSSGLYYSPTQDWSNVDPEPAKAFFRTRIGRFRNDPTLLGHVVTEEPPVDSTVVARIGEVTAAAHEADPSHFAFAEYHWADAAVLAAQLIRPPVIVFGVGPFPADLSDDAERRRFYPLIMEQSFQAASSAEIPLWVLTQGSHFDLLDNGKLIRRMADRPTPAQLRWEVWSALLHGAKGIGYFAYSYPYPHSSGVEEYIYGLVSRTGKRTKIYEEASRISRRLRPIKRLLLRLEAESSLLDENDPYWSEGDLVRARVFRHTQNGQRYVMVANYDFRGARPARVPAELGASRLTDMLSGRTWSSTNIGGLSLRAGDGVLLRIN